MNKIKPGDLDGLFIWSFEMSHGLTRSTFYIVTTERDIAAAAEKAEGIRNNEDRFIARECDIRNIQYLGTIEDDEAKEK